jgi:hypothetical protein
MLVMMILFLFISNLGFVKTINASMIQTDVQNYNLFTINVDQENESNNTLEIEKWSREIKVDAWGTLTVTEFLQFNKPNGSSITFFVLSNATNIIVQDVFGIYDELNINLESKEDYLEAEIFFREELNTFDSIKLLLSYELPSPEYIVQRNWQDYMLQINLILPDMWTVKVFEMIIVLPEGAEFQSLSMSQYEIIKEGFSEKAKYILYNLTEFIEQNIELEYRYIILWIALRPLLLFGTSAAVLGGALFLKLKYKRKSVTKTTLHLDSISNFLQKYEQDQSLKLELESLDSQVRMGKISKRKYKLRKSSLVGHISQIKKEIETILKNQIFQESKYGNMVKQLNIADAEIETIKNNIQRVRTRLRQRQISTEAHNKLMIEYNKIKERAENKIEEILLRFREDINI